MKKNVDKGKVPMYFEVYYLIYDFLICGAHGEYLFEPTRITPNVSCIFTVGSRAALATIRTGLRVHFVHHHVRDTIVIVE